MKSLRKSISTLIAAIAIVLCILFLLPLQYGGTSPVERLLRMNNGGNVVQSIADSAAIVSIFKNGIFDISYNNQDGVFIYSLDEDKIETYWYLGEGKSRTSTYIVIQNGVRYRFVMNQNGWRFEDSRVCLTDLNRLQKNLALILTEKQADTSALAIDLNGIFGIDLTKYLNFEFIPTVVRSLINNFNDELFQQATGYSFKRDNFTLQYRFAPTDSKNLADRIHTIAKPAYTKTLQNIVNVAGIAGGIADLIGFDVYDILFKSEVTLSIGALSGKLINFSYKNDDVSFSATNRKYGGCQIDISSEQLDALILEHII